MTPIASIQSRIETALAGQYKSLDSQVGELTLTVTPEQYLSVARVLRDDAELYFETALDLCGVDFSTYGDGRWDGARYAAVTHLLSVKNNCRLRLRVFAQDDDFPVLPSLLDIWPAVGWYEREAFDLFGLMFDGHPDLRRILTDYGFVGHPFRKDFPVTGYVEMRYDPEQKRVVYQPVTIDPREIIPRVIREEGYGVGR